MAIQGKNINIVFLLGLAFVSCVANGTDIDVTTLGVKAGGDCKANAESLTQAWAKACHCTAPAKLVVPPGEYVIGPVVFAGPCSNPVTFELQGTLKAATDASAYTTDTWILFDAVENVVITGKGTFDGQGASFWASSKCRHNNHCKIELPSSLKFRKVRNVVLSDFTSLNSPAFHIHVIDSNNLTAQCLTITAPGDSPNTDGMHISTSTLVKVLDSKIGTGDDCVSIGQGNKDITVSGVQCGPGHGISVGSLGKYPDETDVSNVLVSNCNFTGTTNGVRIKTWPASPAIKATGITFQDINFDNVENPIVINQKYGLEDSSESSKVQLCDVHFKNIKGTTTTPAAVSLVCSSAAPCSGLELCDIDLVNKAGGALTAQCSNAKLATSGTQNPPPCV